VLMVKDSFAQTTPPHSPLTRRSQVTPGSKVNGPVIWVTAGSKV